MEIALTRSLNGIPKTKEEMKSYIFKSDIVSKIIKDVNDRAKNAKISTGDKNQKLCCNL